jgi:DNA-binding transcriptional regulator YhcF (GntR family)
MEHPSHRIVTEIRRRITTGELRPGDRVPSTRQITQEWGVAMATATKVLNTLRQQGVVRAVQGVGTVVESTPSAPPAAHRTTERELTRERIVRAAIEIADAEGLAAVSMRRTATELGTATMSLYRHVQGKDELVVLMVDTALTEERFPAEPPEGWRARLELSSRLQWRLYRAHPWLARAVSISRPQAMPNAVIHTEWSLRALDGLGLDPETMLNAYLTVFGFVRGTAVSLESEAEARQDTGLTADEWLESQETAMRAILGAGDYPTMTRLFTHEVEIDLDGLFEFGLRRVLDGLATLISTTP